MSRRARVEPVPGDPAAVAHAGTERVLVVADYHAGIEAGLRYERGVELESAADVRLARLERLLDRTTPDRLLVLGDLVHRIGPPDGDEVTELATLVDRVTDRVPMTLVPGNHDGGVADTVAERGLDLAVTDSGGVRLGPVGFVHGHTWPSAEVLEAEVVCMGHEHPTVRLEDEVGGSRVERAWLRGRLDPTVFEGHGGGTREGGTELVVVPAFNDRSGGTWVNVEGQSFLSPFLPDGLPDGDLYLLDGTRLGHYRRL
jgi:hypothetical protein